MSKGGRGSLLLILLLLVLGGVGPGVGGVAGQDEAASGPTVYFGSDDATLYAADAETGEREWGFEEPEERLTSSPVVVDGTVYVGSRDGSLYAVEATTGEPEWVFTEASDEVFSSPTVVEEPSGTSTDSRVLLGTLNHHDSLRAGERLTAEDLGDVETRRAEVVPPSARDGTRDQDGSGAYEADAEDAEVVRHDIDGNEGTGVFGFTVMAGLVALVVGTAAVAIRRYT